jgi:amidohydrolase
MADLLERARALAPELVALRRDLHRHPELGFQEERTAGIGARRLEALGLDVRTGVGVTGVVAELRHGPGPTVVLRADMDALPIQEEAEHDYASTVPGVMHACGHDAHVAGLIGAATLLAEARDAGTLPSGTFRFLLQPSEERSDREGKSGATRMIEAGALTGADAATGLHVGGPLPSGRVLLGEGAVMGGGEEVHVTVRGRSAHAALPHEGIDAVALAAQGVVATHAAVGRRLAPTDPGVITFGRIEGGQAANVVASEVRVHGTLRYFTDTVRRALEEAVRSAFGGLEAQGARVQVELLPGYPPVVNDTEAARAVRAALDGMLGAGRVLPQPPVLLAEDFAFLAREVPSVFFFVGAALPEPRQHHHPTFDIDESVLPLCAAALARSGLALLAHVAGRAGQTPAPASRP